MTVIVGQHILRLGGILAGVFKKTWDFFGTVWSSTLQPFITWSWNMIQKLHAWLKGVLSPVLTFLQAVRQDILDFYAKWFRPIFDTIDALRQTLRVLETFHVPFARKLDDALGALEARLLVPIRLALQKVNELTNWVNRIIDFNGYFQRLTLVASTWKYERDMWTNWWGSVHRRELDNPKTPPRGTELRTPQSVADDAMLAVRGQHFPGEERAQEYAQTALRVWPTTVPHVR